MQVKIFKCNGPLEKKKVDGAKVPEDRIFEDEINAWLDENSGIKISNIEQSASGGSMNGSLWMISIWYEPAEK